MLIPYATEIYPIQIRGTGSGVVAGSSKLGGIAAGALGAMGLFASLTVSAITLAVLLAASAVASFVDFRRRRPRLAKIAAAPRLVSEAGGLAAMEQTR